VQIHPEHKDQDAHKKDGCGDPPVLGQPGHGHAAGVFHQFRDISEHKNDNDGKQHKPGDVNLAEPVQCGNKFPGCVGGLVFAGFNRLEIGLADQHL
jgi:hypothetical protein